MCILGIMGRVERNFESLLLKWGVTRRVVERKAWLVAFAALKIRLFGKEEKPFLRVSYKSKPINKL